MSRRRSGTRLHLVSVTASADRPGLRLESMEASP